MDWKLFASTFAAIFLAEMGDKTQIATFSLAGSGSSRWVVFAASALALVCTSAVAVLLGEVVSRYVSPQWLKRGAGLVFVVLGVVYLISSFSGPEKPTGDATAKDIRENVGSPRRRAD